MTGRKGAPRPQVNHPLARFDPAPQLRRVRGVRRVQVRGTRARRVGRPHVGVIGRVGVQAGEQLADVPFFTEGENRVGLLLLADGGGQALGLGGRAETAEAVSGVHVRAGRQLRGHPVR